MSEISDSGLKEWEEVSLPPSSSSFSSTQFQSQSQTQFNGKDWEIVANPSIPNSLPYEDCSIFPSSNHEGLHIQTEEAPQPQSSPPTSKRENPCCLFDSLLRIVGKVFAERLRLGFEALYSKMLLVLRLRFASWGFFARRVSWPSAISAAGFMGVLLYMRRRRSRTKENEMLLLIRKKDEKINQLLHQIPQMNELLSAPRRVPVLIISGSAN